MAFGCIAAALNELLTPVLIRTAQAGKEGMVQLLNSEPTITWPSPSNLAN